MENVEFTDNRIKVECVVLLSQLPDEHIDIDINLDELT